MRISCLIAILACFGCGEDPILTKANQEQTKGDAKTDTVSTKEQQNENSVTSTKTKSMPTVAPPKETSATPVSGQLPKIAPPSVAPPKEQPKEAVPPPPPNPKDGDFITIKGTIEANNPNGKPIRIDIFDGDQRNIGGKRPSVVVSTTVDNGPTFEIFLPQKEQQLWVGAYIDEDGDGRPGPLDPSGWYSGNPVSGNKNQEGITLVLGIPNDAPP